MSKKRHIVEPTRRTTARKGRDRSESGDTLVEILLAVVVLGLASVALLIAFGTSISASAAHRQLSASGIALDSISQEVISDIQATPSLFTTCPFSLTAYQNATFLSTATPFTVPAGFTAGFASSTPTTPPATPIPNPVAYWNTTTNSFGATCETGQPQQVTITVVDTANHQSFTNSFVVDSALDTVTGGGSVESGTYGPAAQLAFTTQPVGGSTGQLLATQPVVTVQDSSGNTVLDDLSPVLLTLSVPVGDTMPSGAVLSGCSGSETSGVVTFTGCAVNVAGTYVLDATDGDLSGTTYASTAFTVSASADYLVFSTQPAAGASGSLMATEPVVEAYTTVAGNPTFDNHWTGTITLSASGGSLTNCSSVTVTAGVGTFTSCKFAGSYYYNAISGVYLATPYTLTAAASNSVATSPVTSSAFGVTGPGSASQLVFSTQPTGSASTTGDSTPAFSTQPVVTVEDSFGNIVNSSTASVTLSISSGTLNGCSANPLASSGGSAAFSGCQGSALGNSLTLTASSPGLSSATSASFNITGAASQLIFTTQPKADVSGQVFETQPVITIEDAQGNTVTAASTPITLTASPSSTGTLALCTNLTPYEGVVSVSTCTFAGVVGTPYYLTATYLSLTQNSGLFTPTAAGTPTQLVFAVSPVAGAAGSQFTTQPVVDIEDSAGNITTSAATISLSASGGGTLSSCSNLTALEGVVQVTNCTFGGLDTSPYTLTATSPSLSAATSSSFMPTGPGPASSSQSTVIASPAIVLDNGTASSTVTVTLEDAFTNVISGKSITLSQTGTNAVITPNPVTTSASGVSSFTVTDTNREVANFMATDSTDSVPIIETAQVSFATQLTPPTNVVLSYGTTSGSLGVTFTAPTNAPSGQAYTALACQDSGMTTNCVGPAAVTSGGQITGLSATQGTAGGSYYVTITASASTGYLVSTSGVAGSHAATSQVNAPTNVTVTPSTTAAGALTVTFTASSGTAPSNYTALACTNSTLTSGCATPVTIISGGQITGLTPGAGYFVGVTANPPTGYVSASSTVVGPVVPTVQLVAPSNVVLSYGATAGSIGVTFTTPSNAPGGQTYTVQACIGAGMTAPCITPEAIAAGGGQITGLTAVQGSAGLSYYVTVTATASTGYLSATSTIAGPHAAMSQVGAPISATVTSSTSTAGAVVINFTNSSGTAPTSYTAQACTGVGTGCIGSPQTVTSGSQITGLTAGTNYYVALTANAPTGYLPAEVDAGPGMATIQINQPTSVALGYGTTSGSVTVTFTAPSNPAVSQAYTTIACQNLAMTLNCSSPISITSGGQITGLSATQGSAGVAYFATVTATASTGYLVSTSAVSASHADTSQVDAPTGFSTASSTTTAGAITAQYTNSGGVAPASYTATACTVSNMTGTCITKTSYTTGSQITGLVQGTNYYVTITAVAPSTAYVSAATAISAATLATTQLNAPNAVVSAATGTAAASLSLNGSGSSNAPSGQTYTYQVCTVSAGNGCLAVQNVAGAPQIITTTNGSTALTAGTTYWVQVTATASTGYLASTAQAGSAIATLQLGTPTGVSGTASGSNALSVSWTNPSNDPSGTNGYTIRACLSNTFTGTCFNATVNTSGSSGIISGLATNTNYFVEVMENAFTGYIASAFGIDGTADQS